VLFYFEQERCLQCVASQVDTQKKKWMGSVMNVGQKPATETHMRVVGTLLACAKSAASLRAMAPVEV